jgi:Ca2+-binding RTX toxin-like protein
VAALVTAAAIWLPAAGPQPAPGATGDLRCLGARVTIMGTDGPDQLRGTPGTDVIYGGDGADAISGLNGGDRICGGPGDDTLAGGLRGDRISGGPGNDTIAGGAGSDRLYGNDGTDWLRGARGNDFLDGGAGDSDQVFGDLGDDRVRGGSGNRDLTSGGLGIDIVAGGPGNGDVVSGDYGDDRMIGGPGTGDLASFATAVPEKSGLGVDASLLTGRASGDGHDRLFGFEDLEGSPFADVLQGDRRANVIDAGAGDDHVLGGGGADTANGAQGSDSCRAPTVVSCRREPPIRAAAYVQLDHSSDVATGMDVIAGPGADRIRLAFDQATGVFTVTAARPLALGEGCARVDGTMDAVTCAAGPNASRVIVSLGAGNDQLTIGPDLRTVDQVRVAGGPGNDVIQGGAEADLFEAGSGVDRLYGGLGSDGLIGGIPGADLLYGERGGDLLAAGSACIGGALIGGRGRDNASFAETPAHPGVLYASLAAGYAKIAAIPGCRPVRLASSDEDLEGSFDWDVLVGDGGPNGITGQPGRDVFMGLGGNDSISARDGERDFSISCGPGDDVLSSDRSDPPGRSC